MRRVALIIALAVPAVMAAAEGNIQSRDTLPRPQEGEVATSAPRQEKKGIFNALYQFVKKFSQVDTNYVEPQKYNFEVMLQNTNTYEAYTISTSNGQHIRFAPDVSIKAGPYVGWRWIFLGYTIDLTHLNGGSNKQDFNMSLYSSQIGLDLFYRKTGNDYKIREMNLGEGVDTSPLKNVSFDGIEASIKGFNAYYIFNHRKFSYPAAYSQSTIQRRSAGSFLAGFGYTTHSLKVDWQKLGQIIEDRLGSTLATQVIDDNLVHERIHYADVSLSAGYAYNWVFAHNWLFDMSLSLALAYKHSTGDMERSRFKFRDFSFANFNLDGVLRTGLVWNNSKWYAGANAIFHSYNYHKSQFSTNTYFGNINIYVGFNFGRKK
ncbi:DUF4421 domain-containing protein [Prevotella sp. KH2C16]|uniref:DUF4421 domain-containing protein n=1 Tax=Prevotella sp. KH2C16 TaxID=1855325 RepID=UPI0008F2D614|nr:DUF4421 domain-containing protein [Prevotella sp. KH2C16]SFG11189.1 protein of unknown function [Prevotella sp. KH2C16]